MNDKDDEENKKKLSSPEADEDKSGVTEAITNYAIEIGEPPEKEVRLLPNTVAIYVPGRATPFTFKDKEEIVLGRSDISDKVLPDVDLAAHRGGLLGVSRRHALIRQTDSDYQIEDQNSINGTRVNKTRLMPEQPYPLENGDQVQLGQLILFIYFYSK
jgi:pSer/pThr/pTyr-binding forkhead associated (FHA) protein